MHLDEFLKLVGEFGLYQKKQYALVCIVSFYTAVVIYGMVFFAAAPDHHCTIPVEYTELSKRLYGENASDEQGIDLSIPWEEKKNGNFERSSCFLVAWENYENVSRFGENITGTLPLNGSTARRAYSVDNVTVEACPEGRTYSQDIYKSTVVSEFDLKCDGEWQISFSKSMFFVGKLVGDLMAGMVCDRFGRRPTHLVSILLSSVAGIVLALSPVMAVYTSAVFLLGFLNPFYYLSVFNLGLEFAGVGKRRITGFVVHIFFGLGSSYVALVAYVIRNWRHLALVLLSPAFIFGISWFLLPESFRWLLSRGRTEEAKKVLNRVVKINKAKVDESVIDSVLEDDRNTSEATGNKTMTAWDMLRTRRRALFTLNICFNWLVNGMVYYGISLNTESLGGSLYLNAALLGIIEIPGYILVILLIDRLGRRKLLSISLVAAGISCTVSGALPVDLHWLIVTTAVIGKLCITCSFGMIYFLTSECYPTMMRTVALGTSSAFARIGSALAPQLILLKGEFSSLPFIILGIVSLAAGLLSLFFPETMGLNLMQSTNDFDALLRTPIFTGKQRQATDDRSNKESSKELLDLKKDQVKEKSDII